MGALAGITAAPRYPDRKKRKACAGNRPGRSTHVMAGRVLAIPIAIAGRCG